MKKLVCLLLALVLLVSMIPMAALAAEETVSNEMAVTSVTLRTMEGKEGMFYNANFCLSAESIAALQADTSSCYGLALSTTYLADQAAWTDGLNGTGAAKVLRSTYAFRSNPLTVNVNKKVNSTSLVNIININNDAMTNQRNGATVVYVRPYYQVDGQFTFGAVQACSMQDVAEMVDDYYNYTVNGAPYLNDTQKKGLLGMYERFYSLMTKWDMPTLSADYEAGNELILQYRREKVVANMQAQQEILWTIDSNEPISYSRVPSSQGDEQDVLNGSQYAGDLYTLYPGRIYRGIPYTHGSSGLDIYYTMAGGSANEDGVYVLQGLNRSFLNSGSSDGALAMLNSLGEAVGQYRVARMGNDCWDAISWAYESIGADIDAGQTDQLTPYFGMYPVGNYDFDVFVDTDNTHKPDGEIAHEINTYFKGLIVEYDKINLIYDAYAQLLPGDTLVNDTHALLCTGVEVVYTPSSTGAYVKDADGNFVYEGRNFGSNRYDIDATKSRIYFLEQASGDEKAQSHEDSFFIDNLDRHNAGICVAGACKYCAGYDAEAGVWDLAQQREYASFENLLKGEQYIPVRPAILNDATVKPLTVRISDSLSTKDSSNVTKLFDGELASNNRISQVTLNIYQNGDLVNSATCFGTQSDLTGNFDLSRFTTDLYAGAFGSVLYGTPGLICQPYYTARYAQKLDENGNLLFKTVTAGNALYIYEPLTDAEGNPIYREGVVDADGNPVPLMYVPRNAYGSFLFNQAAEDTLVPDIGRISNDTYVVEADPDILSAGEYYYEMTCQLANGRKITFRSGSFLVSETLTEAGNYTVTAN